MSITVLGGCTAQAMRLLRNSPATHDLPTADPGRLLGAPASVPVPVPARISERRQRPPGVKRRHGVYIPLKLRVALTFVAGALWFCFSLWLSRSWIRTLGHDISTPLAILVIAGVALIPGYLNIQLISSILLDIPRPLRFDGRFSAGHAAGRRLQRAGLDRGDARLRVANRIPRPLRARGRGRRLDRSNA